MQLGTISGTGQYVNANNPTNFGACIKNRTIQELSRRTTVKSFSVSLSLLSISTEPRHRKSASLLFFFNF